MNDGQAFTDNEVVLTAYSNQTRWGVSSTTDALGYAFDMYIDNVVVDGTLFKELDKVDNGTTTTYTSRIDASTKYLTSAE